MSVFCAVVHGFLQRFNLAFVQFDNLQLVARRVTRSGWITGTTGPRSLLFEKVDEISNGGLINAIIICRCLNLMMMYNTWERAGLRSEVRWGLAPSAKISSKDRTSALLFPLTGWESNLCSTARWPWAAATAIALREVKKIPREMQEFNTSNKQTLL